MKEGEREITGFRGLERGERKKRKGRHSTVLKKIRSLQQKNKYTGQILNTHRKKYWDPFLSIYIFY